MKRSILFFLTTIISNGIFAQLHQQFDSLLNAYHKIGLFDGCVLIADERGIQFQEGYGYSNHDHKVPNDLNTVFGIGSMSKSFTAMVILQMIQDGDVKFEDPVIMHLPEYRNDIADKVTIRHLLTHTSGIPSYTALPHVWEDSMQTAYTSQYILKNFGSGDLEFKPGSKYNYGNTGYFILAMIIERLKGKSLGAVLQQQVFDPLKMKNSGINDNRRIIMNKANGYYRLGNEYINESYIFNLNTLGASGVHSTITDLFNWDRALYRRQLLNEEYMRLYTSPFYKVAPDYSYGYGWEFSRLPLEVNDTIEIMGHSGAIRGFRSVIFRIPSERKCIILLSNAANQSGYDIFEGIMQIFRGREWQQPKKILGDTLFLAINEVSIEHAVKLYKTLKSGAPGMFDYSSYALELLGERLMMLGQYDWAAAIFRLAINEFPDYTYGYLYLGRSYERLGQISEAISAYQKAVEKNRDSRPGRDAAFQLKYLLQD